MNRHLSFLALIGFLVLSAFGSEDLLTTVYQPLLYSEEGPPVASPVPYGTAGPYPETYFNAITQQHPPLTSYPDNGTKGDVNAASRAGISISCDSATGGQTKLYIIWDFTKANKDLVNKNLIKALLECLERTAGKNIHLYSKFIGADQFTEFKKMVETRYPKQTPKQFEEDSRTLNGPNGSRRRTSRDS